MHKIKKHTFEFPKKSRTESFLAFSFGKFSIKKQTFFAKRLSFLIKAGVPMLESMHVIKAQSKSSSEKKVFDRVIGDISNGQSLAASLGKFKGVFGNFAINIIKAGESSGTLTQNLSYLADELRKKEILRKKIMGALLYPVVITIATFCITGLLIVYVFPKILPIFKNLNAELPFSTRFIIWLSDTVRHDGLYIFLGVVSFIITAWIIIKKSYNVRFVFHGLILRAPIAGVIVRNYNLTNVIRTLGLLLKSGMPLTEALIITAETTENLQYKKVLEVISVGVTRGKPISHLIEPYSVLFPAMVQHMISIGEKSGHLSNTLLYLSEYYENEFDDLTKNLSTSIEPVLMIIMGLMVGFLAISIITPIYGITEHLRPK